MILQTLAALKEYGCRIAAVHLENDQARVSAQLRDACNLVLIKRNPAGLNLVDNAHNVSQLLFGGLREIVAESFAAGTRAVAYMEADKHTFVSALDSLTAPILQGRTDVSLAVRSAAGFARYPWIQRVVERNVNRYLAGRVGVQADYLYGPRAFSPRVAPLFDEYTENDWGLMMYPALAAITRSYPSEFVEVSGYPQPNYMLKYDAVMRSPPAHLIWRSIQNLAIMKAARAASRS
jgi:hypothetical protein